MVIFIFVRVIIMTLFLKRDVSADNRRFVIFDECGDEKYYVYAKRTKVSAKNILIITDTDDRQAARVRRVPIVGTSAHVLKFGNRHVTFVTVPTPNGVYSYFYGSNWRVSGDIATKNFTIIDVDKTVILEHRRHADYCELIIPDSSNELFCVAASVCANLINTVDKRAVQTA